MSGPTETVGQKAARLLAQGRIEPDPAPARIFHVDGDHGRYTVVVSAHHRSCSCPHGQRGGEGDCSHLTAAILWWLAEAETEAAELGADLDATDHARHLAALAERKARDEDIRGRMAWPDWITTDAEQADATPAEL